MYSVWVDCEFKCMNPCKRKAERYFIGRHTEEKVMCRQREKKCKGADLENCSDAATGQGMRQAIYCKKWGEARDGFSTRASRGSAALPNTFVSIQWPLLCTSGSQDCEESVSVVLCPQVWVICSTYHWKWIHSQASFFFFIICSSLLSFIPSFSLSHLQNSLLSFVYTLAFWIFTLVDLPKKQVQCRMVGWPTDSCAKIRPNVSIILFFFFNIRLDHISELEFSCISNSTLALNTGWGE